MTSLLWCPGDVATNTFRIRVFSETNVCHKSCSSEGVISWISHHLYPGSKVFRWSATLNQVQQESKGYQPRASGQSNISSLRRHAHTGRLCVLLKDRPRGCNNKMSIQFTHISDKIKTTCLILRWSLSWHEQLWPEYTISSMRECTCPALMFRWVIGVKVASKWKPGTMFPSRWLHCIKIFIDYHSIIIIIKIVKKKFWCVTKDKVNYLKYLCMSWITLWPLRWDLNPYSGKQSMLKYGMVKCYLRISISIDSNTILQPYITISTLCW